MVVGFQDPWVVGSRFYYRRDPIDGAVQPFLDLGVIQTASPAVETTRLELFDADGGLGRLFDSAVSRITEAYDITVNNLSLENLALLLLAKPPKSFSQTAEEKTVDHVVQKGYLLKIHDDDAALTNLFGLTAIAGIYTGAIETKVIESITKSTRIITLTGDQTAEAGLAAGKSIIVNRDGLTNLGNSRSYTVVSATLNTGKTDVVVAEEPAATEAAITGKLTIESGGTIYEQDDDWDIVNLDRGIARILDAGSIVDGATLKVVFSKAALSGGRLINPQDFAAEIQGDAILVYGRRGNAEQTARECRVSIAPNSANFTSEDYSSMVLNVRVLNDITEEVPAGRMLHFKGNVPDKS